MSFTYLLSFPYIQFWHTITSLCKWFFSNARTYSIFSDVINNKWKCICSCHRGIAARRCWIWQNLIHKRACVFAFSLFFCYDRIIKLWCILEASLLIAGSSYSRSFQRTFQKHDTSMASISCSLSMKRSRSLLCMAKQSASHINTHPAQYQTVPVPPFIEWTLTGQLV